MKTAVMTDTNSCLTPAQGKEKGIFVVPRPLSIDGQLFKEGENLTREMLYDAVKNNKEIFNLEPSAFSIKTMWDDILSKGYDHILYIPMSSSIGDEYDASIRLAKDYGKKIVIIDNKHISLSQRNSVLDAQHMAEMGIDIFEIKSVLDFNASRNVMLMAADDIKRVGKSAKLSPLASMMNTKPIFKIIGGKLEPFSKGKGIEGCIKPMVDVIKKELENDRGRTPENCICIGAATTLESEEAEDQWVSKVKKFFPKLTVVKKQLSSAMVCSIGLNAIGLSLERVERDITKD
ncbi:MAG: DegV family protein [Ruminococcus sp.]|nr:DegV family protein [Ruminococcus sp.]